MADIASMVGDLEGFRLLYQKLREDFYFQQLVKYDCQLLQP
jgi:hypothetical protein